ncbi:hypothetical protein KCP77_02040 [Salmonella enterica subsp. enterica]|nr:hypothetical protein KCP77_02040 [Salmonella enterica subsp. enterica]
MKGADQLVERGRALFWSNIPLLGFDLIYEPADKLNHNMASLNRGI